MDRQCHKVLNYLAGRKMTSFIDTLENEVGDKVCGALPFPLGHGLKHKLTKILSS